MYRSFYLPEDSKKAIVKRDVDRTRDQPVEISESKKQRPGSFGHDVSTMLALNWTKQPASINDRRLPMKITVGIVVATVILTACATTDEIIIDNKGVDVSAYEQDLAECQSYSAEVKKGEKTAKGAASGAVIGGLIGAITGGVEGATRGAGVGAVGGGAKGASQGEQDEVQVVKSCLRGRGYKVLN